jgi:hypothetical protein
MGVARSAYRLGAWSKPLLGSTMEMDCLELVNLWNNRCNSRSIMAPILLDFGELASSFTSFSILHVMRTANYPAHLCASTLCVTESWMDDTRSFLVSSLLADCPANAFVWIKLSKFSAKKGTCTVIFLFPRNTHTVMSLHKET